MEKSFQPPILLFDSECPLCVRFKQGLEHLDIYKKIQYETIHQDDIYQHFPSINKEDCQKEVHLILVDGSILKGPQVVTYLLKQFPGVDKFAWLLESERGQKVVDFFYKAVDEIRLKIQHKEEDCHKCPKR